MNGEQAMRVVIIQEGSGWYAQCLEHDIGAQGDTLDDVYARLEAVIVAELETSMEINGEPFKGIAPAPEYFHDLWERRTKTFVPAAATQIPTDGEKVKMDVALYA